MILRPATGDDVAAVEAMERLLFGDDAWSSASVREELTGTRRTAVLACDPDPVGYVVSAAAGDVTDLQRIGVHPGHRRQQVAHRLLAAVATDGRMLLEVAAGNQAALAFYTAEGFTEIDRRRGYYRGGVDAVVMERRGESPA